MTVERIKELKEIERQIKELESLANSLKEELKAEMGGEEHMEVGGYKVNYTVVISNRFNSKGLKEKNPEIYNQFVEETITRRFSIS